MRPRLKDDAYFTRVDEGLVWLTPAGLLTVKEPSVAAMVERLAPRLNGRHTVDELTARLPERTRRLIVELLDVLVRQGLVEDARPGRTLTTSAEPDAAFVQQVTGDPDAALHRYRNGRALVMGPDPLLAHCVGALSASGVTTVETVLDEGGTAPEPEDAVHAIVHGGIDFALHLFDSTGLSHASALAGVCADRDIPLVQGLVSESEVLVGPCATVDWTSVWRRLRAEDRKPFEAEPGPPTGAAGRVLANHMVFRLFRCVTGAAGPEDQRLFSFATRTLETRCHDVLPHFSVRTARPQSRVDFVRTVRELRRGRGCTEAQFSTRAVQAIDARFGPIRDLAEDELPQLPLRQARALVAAPSWADGPVVVTASGPDFATARHRTALKAIGTYGAMTVDPRRLHMRSRSGGRLPDEPDDVIRAIRAGEAEARLWGIRLDDAQPCLVDAREAFPVLSEGSTLPTGLGFGLDWTTMTSVAVLAQCRATVLADPREVTGPQVGQEVTDTDPVSRRYRRLLTALGHDLRLVDLSGRAGVPTVAVMVNGAAVQVMCRLRLVEAVRACLEAVLVAAQSGRPLSCTGRRVRESTAQWSPPQDASLDDAVSALRQTGQTPVLVPLNHDPMMNRITPYAGNVVLISE
ncbi:hypothetical protein OG229_33995 [Streptomyces platensis]|uniref:hypothetical protein n=1 Tax=Streptomyces platensis TaxID=58346 RepID=UPI002E13D838|nr:hypothetical protein OG229_33995 [Streptomyces platensis]